MSKINVRSPYYINISAGGLVSATLKLRIYEGNSSTSISGFQYELTSTAINNSVTFEISELVRDYIENTFDGDYTNSAKWLRYEYFYILGTGGGGGNGDAAIFDGYGYFSEGANPQNTQTVLQSNKTIYKYSDAPLRLPVHITTSTEFTFLQNGSSIYNTTLDPSTNSNDIIRYVSSETTGDSFVAR